MKWYLIGITLIALSLVAIKTAFPEDLEPNYIKAQEIIGKKKQYAMAKKQYPIYHINSKNYWDDSGSVNFSVNQMIFSPVPVEALAGNAKMISCTTPIGLIILLPGPPPRNIAAEPFVEWAKE